MPRQLRSYFPGGFFHVTARTQGRVHWFDEIMRGLICSNIGVVQRRCDISICAFVVMPNHLHFLLQQGDYPLHKFMHPLLTRVAAAVKKRYRVEGHIFERRYWDHPCTTPEYLLRCVQYIHGNPVKAGLSQSAGEYRWSSAGAYAGNHHTSVVVTPLGEAMLSVLPKPPAADESHIARPTRYLGDVVNHVLRQYRPAINVDVIRLARGRAATAVRRECIHAALAAGYRNMQIARFLNISDATVSKVAVVYRGNQVLRQACEERSKIEDEKQARKNRAAEAALFPRLTAQSLPTQ